MRTQVPPARNPTEPPMRTQEPQPSTKKPVAIVYKESLARSIISDLATFGLLLLCAYVSQGSTWWTLVTGVLFISYFVMQLQRFTNSDSTIRFYSLDDMQAWLDKQKGPSHDQQTQRIMDDAELGRIAMRYVDRAGDLWGEDSAEKICAEFVAEMGDAIDRQCAKRGMPSEKYDANGNLRKSNRTQEPSNDQ